MRQAAKLVTTWWRPLAIAPRLLRGAPARPARLGRESRPLAVCRRAHTQRTQRRMRMRSTHSARAVGRSVGRSVRCRAASLQRARRRRSSVPGGGRRAPRGEEHATHTHTHTPERLTFAAGRDTQRECTRSGFPAAGACVPPSTRVPEGAARPGARAAADGAAPHPGSSQRDAERGRWAQLSPRAALTSSGRDKQAN